MWPFHNILFAFDSCPQCRKALQQAAQLAGKCQSRLVLCDTAKDTGKVDPARRIVACAQKEEADLIFLPRHSGGIQPWLLAHTMAGVLGRAKCPVWIAPPEDAAGGPVVCALKAQAGDEDHLLSAAGIAGAYGRSLHLVHAVPEVSEPKQRLAAFERAMAWLMEFRRKLARTAEVAVHAGEVVKVVLQIARVRKASLVVIGRGGSSREPGHLGEHAYRIAREASCAVLVGAPAAAADLMLEQENAA